MEKVNKENKENISKENFKKMTSSKASVALNMNPRNTIEGSPKFPPNPDNPSVEHFDLYLPFACLQMQVFCPVIVTRVIMQEYVHKLAKGGHKSKQKMHLSPPTSPITHSASPHAIASGSEANSYTPETTIDLDAVYNINNDLIQINFHKDTFITADVLKVIGLIIPFYPYLTRITIHSRTYEHILHEMSKFLTISNLTEIILDGCRLLCTQYEVLLENPGKLSQLSLARCRIDDPLLKNICEKLAFPLPASKTLNLLNLSSNRISDVGAVYIATFLRTNRRLKYLNLSGNWLTDKGAQSILNMLKDFPLTFEEDQAAGKRYMEYIIKKIKVTASYLKDVKTQVSRRANPISGRKAKVVERRVSSSHDMSDEYRVAYDMASQTIGNFNDPYSRQDIFTKHGILFSYGNNTLCYLNLSYNQLSANTMDLVLEVLNHQASVIRKPIGLLKVCLEGNPMPKWCDELSKIDQILEARGLSLIDSINTKKKIMKKSSKDLV